MVLITIVNGVYKPTYNWGAPPYITQIGSMVLLYMVCHGSHQYSPFMLANIPAPWILWVLFRSRKNDPISLGGDSEHGHARGAQS